MGKSEETYDAGRDFLHGIIRESIGEDMKRVQHIHSDIYICCILTARTKLLCDLIWIFRQFQTFAIAKQWDFSIVTCSINCII